MFFIDKYKKGVTRVTEHFNATTIRQEKFRNTRGSAGNVSQALGLS